MIKQWITAKPVQKKGPRKEEGTYVKVTRVRIEAVQQAVHDELVAKYELPLEQPCPIAIGSVWIVDSTERPAGMCRDAWEILEPYVRKLLEGGGHFQGEWMRDPYSAMVSCPDGFRPMTFYLEVLK